MHRVPTDTMEDEADTFAGELLAPFALVRKDLIGGRVTLERLVQLKMYWRVSVASLLYKVGKSGFLSANQSGYLWKQLAARGWKLREPDETQFPAEAPRLYEHVVSLHSNEMGYSANDLMKMLHVNDDVLHTLYGLRPSGDGGRRFRVIK